LPRIAGEAASSRIQSSPRSAISTFCDDPEEVEARSLLAFCAAIGAHFLAADHGDRTRREVLARAADLLLEDRAEDARR